MQHQRKKGKNRKGSVNKIRLCKTSLYHYELSDGRFFSIDDVGANLDTVFVEPDSSLMSELYTSGYKKELKASGFPKTPQKSQVVVIRAHRLYGTSTNELKTAHDIKRDIHMYHIERNSDLAKELKCITQATDAVQCQKSQVRYIGAYLSIRSNGTFKYMRFNILLLAPNFEAVLSLLRINIDP